MRRGTRIRLALLCTMFALVAVYGWALYNGISGDPASAGAAEFPARGADDYLAAMRTLDRDGESRPDPGAIALLERSAREGYAPAQYRFGIALREGDGVSVDPGRALAFLRMAAEAGDTHAQFELGRMYSAGLGVLRDVAQGFAWLNLAAENGLPDAAIARDTAILTMSADAVLEAKRQARRMLVTFASTRTASAPRALNPSPALSLLDQ